MRTVLVLLVALSLAFAPAPFPRSARKPAGPTMEGAWRNENNHAITLTVTSDTMHFGHSQAAPERPYNLTFNASTNPKRFAITHAGGAAFVGIYRINGDVLTLHYRPAHRPYPTSFDEGDVFREVYVRKRN
jgi:uncharacterized protein (TIGR03067 family)